MILAIVGATVKRVGNAGDVAGPIAGIALEQRLRARDTLATRPPNRRFMLTLAVQIQGYTWRTDGGDGLRARRGERIEIAMRNAPMMAHAMRLHGHHFRVMTINGAKLSGVVRDTVLVPHAGEETIVFDANNSGKGPLHYHPLYPMATGMRAYAAFKNLDWRSVMPGAGAAAGIRRLRLRPPASLTSIKDERPGRWQTGVTLPPWSKPVGAPRRSPLPVEGYPQ